MYVITKTWSGCLNSDRVWFPTTSVKVHVTRHGIIQMIIVAEGIFLILKLIATYRTGNAKSDIIFLCRGGKAKTV